MNNGDVAAGTGIQGSKNIDEKSVQAGVAARKFVEAKTEQQIRKPAHEISAAGRETFAEPVRIPSRLTC